MSDETLSAAKEITLAILAKVAIEPTPVGSVGLIRPISREKDAADAGKLAGLLFKTVLQEVREGYSA
jgi:hypothetical protein